MAYAFDRVVDRRHTDSLKYDFAAQRGKPADILPFWVADMDFPTPECVQDALSDRVRHGIFGYSESGEDYIQALEGWFTGRFGYRFRPEWVVKTPGVVYAICTAIRALTQPGDAVLIQEPVYYPFRSSILANGRRLAVNNLQLTGGQYVIDFADFERQIVENGVRLFLLCSPHNPVGRVWSETELRELAAICARHDVLIVSDEIHCDFVYPGNTHHLLPALLPELRDRIILCTAPSKTFNLAGLQLSNIFISDPGIQRAFLDEMERGGYSQAGGLGLVACRAAYAGGADWLEALVGYLGESLDYLDHYLQTNLPDIGLIRPQGTYLAWLDLRALGLTAEQQEEKMVREAGLWLDGGHMFGPAGEGFQRINIACPRALLETVLTRLSKAFAR